MLVGLLTGPNTLNHRLTLLRRNSDVSSLWRRTRYQTH